MTRDQEVEPPALGFQLLAAKALFLAPSWESSPKHPLEIF